MLADAGFGSTAFITGCAKLELSLIVGVSCDRTTEQGIKYSALRVQGAMLFLKGCSTPVFVAWFKLLDKNGAFQWRYKVMSQLSLRRLCIEDTKDGRQRRS